jgi:hypothetical protein
MNKELAEDYFYISPDYYGKIYRENQNLNVIILKILDARAGDEAIYTPQVPYYVFNECDFYADSDQMSETAQVNLIENFARKLLERSEAPNKEAAKILNRRFWDLV